MEIYGEEAKDTKVGGERVRLSERDGAYLSLLPSLPLCVAINKVYKSLVV